MSSHSGHPERLLLALDESFDNPPAAAAATQDIDAIIPNEQVQALADDLRFWDARDAVNERFKSEGLYITHLFPESEVFLRRDWIDHIVPLSRLRLNHLKLFRPATVDLVLTKMMRGNDEQDMADAAFMIRHDRLTESQLLEAFLQMKPIELVELRDAFSRARPIILNLAKESAAR